jgi:hypothetical protein
MKIWKGGRKQYGDQWGHNISALCCPGSKWEKLDNKRSQYMYTRIHCIPQRMGLENWKRTFFPPLLNSSLLWLVAVLKLDLNWEGCCLRACCFSLDYVCLSFCIMLRNSFTHTRLTTDRNARYKLYTGKIIRWTYMSFPSTFRTCLVSVSHAQFLPE